MGPDGNATPLRYRYKITPAANVNSFKPKQVPTDTDLRNMRSSMLGTVYLNKLNTLPRAAHFDIVWEEGIRE